MAVIYGNDGAKLDNAAKEAQAAFKIGKEPIQPPKLIKEIIGL